MKQNNIFWRLLKRKAAAGILALALCLSGSVTLCAYAGPGDDSALAAGGQEGPSGSGGLLTGGTKKAGPGTQPEEQQAAAPDNSYYNQPLSAPIVNPADRYSYEQMEQDIQALAARYPGRVTVTSIGQSLDGRNIYDVIIGNPSASKKILFQGAIHGREYIVVPLMMQQMEYLAASYDGGTYQEQPMSAYLDNMAVHFVPMANPDGVALSQFGENAIRSPELRGTIQTAYALDIQEGRTVLGYEEYLMRWKANARGVDLNHNFDAGWEQIEQGLLHGSFSGYKGTAPLSEPESQALNQLAQQTGFSAIVNYHAMGSVLYWNTENNLRAEASLEMAQAVSAATGYTVLNSNGMGGFKDWMQRCGNPVAGITIEVGRSTCPVSFSEYQRIWNENKAVPAIFCQYVMTH